MDVVKRMENAGYKIYKCVGVKPCYWFRQKLRYNRACYKEKFYGIEAHRCLQMSPSMFWCQNRCLYCWRYFELSDEFNKSIPSPEWIEPKEVVEKSVELHRQCIVGYKGCLDKLYSEKYFEEAWNPKHVAISLSGEPTIYPYIDELIEEYNAQGFTTFLVTNGINTEKIMKCKPTQLYLSLSAPNEEIHKRLQNPSTPNSWERIKNTLEYLGTYKGRKVIRITCVKGYNMCLPQEYAKLIEMADPKFIEVKGYMHVGFAKSRLSYENAPTHEEVKNFAKEILEFLPDYELRDEQKESTVVLLVKKDIRNTKINFD
jgi:tRNA wybutosine-synthesizing protein 1